MLMATETQRETPARYRLKRMRADHSFHPTMSLLEKALKFRQSAKLAHRNNSKIMEDPEAKETAQELVRHARFWYVKWNEYRTNLKIPPDTDEIEEAAKTRNGQVVQAAKGLGWALQQGESTGEPAKRLLRAALRLKTDPQANRRRLDTTETEKAPQNGAGNEEINENCPKQQRQTDNMTNATRTEEQKLHVRRAGTDETKKVPITPSQTICNEPAEPELLLTDVKFMALGANHRCASCERIQNRAIQTVKLKKGEGPVRPKDLQDVYSHELTD